MEWNMKISKLNIKTNVRRTSFVLSSYEPVPLMTHPSTNRCPVTAWYHRVNSICPSHTPTDRPSGGHLQPELKYPHRQSIPDEQNSKRSSLLAVDSLFLAAAAAEGRKEERRKNKVTPSYS